MAEETVDRCVEIAHLKPKNSCITKGLLLHGGEQWTPTSYIRLVQDYGLDTEVNLTRLFHRTCFLPLGRYSSFQYLW